MNGNAPLINRRILRLHAENAAFVVSQLRRGQDGPSFRLVDIFDLECRLAGHLDASPFALSAKDRIPRPSLSVNEPSLETSKPGTRKSGLFASGQPSCATKRIPAFASSAFWISFLSTGNPEEYRSLRLAWICRNMARGGVVRLDN